MKVMKFDLKAAGWIEIGKMNTVRLEGKDGKMIEVNYSNDKFEMRTAIGQFVIEPKVANVVEIDIRRN